MLEQRDLELIADIFEKAIQPLKQDVSTLKADVASLKTDVASLKTDVATLKTDVASLKTDVATLKTKVTSLETKVASLETKVTSLEITLENETNKNIRIIAEGHLDLNRKLDDAISNNADTEILKLRVTKLEHDLNKIKSKLGIA